MRTRMAVMIPNCNSSFGEAEAGGLNYTFEVRSCLDKKANKQRKNSEL